MAGKSSVLRQNRRARCVSSDRNQLTQRTPIGYLVSGGIVLFLLAFGKSENGFVKQGSKDGVQMWFQILGMLVGTIGTFPSKFQQFRFWGPDSGKSILQFKLFRRGRRKSETSLVHQVSILSDKCSLRFFKGTSEHPQNSYLITCNLVFRRNIFVPA